MKKVPAVLLFAILLVNTAGFYVYYVIALQRIHLEMRAKLRLLPEQELTRLVLSNEVYRASLVEDDEIRLGEKMYDVARIQFQDDSVVVLAIHDEKEENFLAFANEIISKPFQRDNHVTGSVLHFISLVFLPGQQVNSFCGDNRTIEHRSNYLLHLPSFSGQPGAPPPRLTC